MTFYVFVTIMIGIRGYFAQGTPSGMTKTRAKPSKSSTQKRQKKLPHMFKKHAFLTHFHCFCQHVFAVSELLFGLFFDAFLANFRHSWAALLAPFSCVFPPPGRLATPNTVPFQWIHLQVGAIQGLACWRRLRAALKQFPATFYLFCRRFCGVFVAILLSFLGVFLTLFVVFLLLFGYCILLFFFNFLAGFPLFFAQVFQFFLLLSSSFL